jgi:arginine/ornithine transport system substrate-binding protein
VNRRELSRLLITTGIGVFLVGCRGRRSTVLRIGIEAAYPPFMEVGPDGTPRGFEIDIAREIFMRAGWQYELLQNDFAGLIPGLETGKFDAIMASINITDERRRRINFTQPYYRTPAQFVRRKHSDVDVTRNGLAGRRVGVQGTTNLDDWLTRTWGDVAKVIRYSTQDALYLDMRGGGRLDAMFSDLAAATIAFLRKPGGTEFEPFGQPLCGRDVVGEGVAIAVAKNRNPGFLARLNAAITAIHMDGTFARIQKRYFDFDLSCGELG